MDDKDALLQAHGTVKKIRVMAAGGIIITLSDGYDYSTDDKDTNSKYIYSLSVTAATNGYVISYRYKKDILLRNITDATINWS